MSRLALSDGDREVRNWFVTTTESLGCSTTVDSMVWVTCLSHCFDKLIFIIIDAG